MADFSALRGMTASWHSRRVAGLSIVSGGSGAAPRVSRRYEVPPRPTGDAAVFLADVMRGLEADPKQLPAKYMFDAVGARLHACLGSLGEHYLARREHALLRARAGEIADRLGDGVRLVDLACADGGRTALLVDHLERPAQVLLGDRSPGGPIRAATALLARAPDLSVVPLADCDPWNVRFPAPTSQARRTVVYLGGAIAGELEPGALERRLRALASACGAGGAVLASLDLERDPRVLEAAYADRAGVATSFDLNLLARINRELGAGFQLSAFEHRAVYHPDARRLELQLVSKRAQWVGLQGRWFGLGAAEPIVTMASYKYSRETFTDVATRAGLRLDETFLDSDQKWAIALFRT